MGYKLAGCDVIAANDIDPEMAWHYQKNLNPKYYFLCPIKDLIATDLPDELLNLDILDGSPPCSTFSMAGNREASWGKNKHFREGQAKQVLSDLFFDFLDLIEKLQPRVAIAENVKGMIIGNAKGYTKLVMERFKKIGYRPQLFLINAADCGVPQRRERVFFCAARNDINAAPLSLKPSSKWISVGEATADLTQPCKSETKPSSTDLKWWPLTSPGDSFCKAVEKYEGRQSLFSHYKLHEKQPSPTLTATYATFTHWNECRKLSLAEFKRFSSFPDDYVTKTHQLGKYLMGMSVPPKMMRSVAEAVCSQWLLTEKKAVLGSVDE